MSLLHPRLSMKNMKAALPSMERLRPAPMPYALGATMNRIGRISFPFSATTMPFIRGI